MKIHSISKYLFLVTIIAWNCFSLTANSSIFFSHLTIDEGLSQSTVLSISQDKSGFMWFATNDGLNRYDGYAFRTYRHHERDSATIASNITRFIYKDRANTLWIATNEGLSMYNAESDNFENYYFPKEIGNSPVNTIIDMGNNNLLIGTKSGIRILDKKQKKLITDGLTSAMKSIEATSMLKWDGKIFIGTNQGLFLYHIQQRTFEAYCDELQDIRIQSILKQTNSRLWIGTEGNGLFLLNPRNMHVKNYKHDVADSKSISSDFIRSLALDAQNRLWIGTFTDLNIYHESSDAFLKYNHNPLDKKSLSHNSIRSIYQDYQGGMWLGTYFGGINYYHPLRNNFQTIRNIPHTNSLSNNVISCIKEDSKGNIWIGTNDGGLNKYDSRTKRFTHYSKSTSGHKLLSNDVKTVYVDESQDKVYVGTHAGGIAVLDQKTERTQYITSKNSALLNDNVYAILPDENDKIWIGSLQGLQLYNTRIQKFESIQIPNNQLSVVFLYRDKKERIWVGTEMGLSIYDVVNNRLAKVNTNWLPSELATSYINSIYESSNGTYWIGTRSGLFGVHEQKNEKIRLTTDNGLPNDVVHAILEDNFGRIWISSNKGLSCINTSTLKIKNFSVIDRLQSNEFNNYACLKSESGHMYFGGTKGVTMFKPELLMDNPHMPAPVIKRFKIFNNTVKPGDATGILSKSIHLTDSITLTAAQSAFTLNFVVSNYISGRHNLFAYRLKGYEKEWYESELTQVTYSNLPHGEYVFQLKAANNDGRWNDQPTELYIKVLPEWYETKWAITLFILAFVSLIIFVFRYFLVKKIMRKEIEMEKLKQEKNEEINQMKMRFFINLSHELRTPLTLIMAPIQEVIQRTTDRWTRNQLEHAHRNSMRLLRIVNQLLNYRKAELGVFELKVSNIVVHEVVKNQYLAYEKLARSKQIHYTFNSEIEDSLFLADENYIEIMVNNLISNAFKFTPEGGKIDVRLSHEQHTLQIAVTDTGSGIAKEQQSQIFERFYQVDTEQASSGSGIGLSLVQRLVELHHAKIELHSELNKGSQFIISIPTSEDAYTEAEKATNSDPNVSTTSQQEVEESFIYLNEEASNTLQKGNTQQAKRGNILIVEDNDEIRSYLKEGLCQNFEVMVATQGEEALEIIKNSTVDLVLTDIMMPVMDGIKLSKAIKQNIRTCHIPVIALSAKSDIKDQLDALQVGVDDYIPKPFSLAVLNMKIQNLMRTRHRIFEHYSKSLEIEPHKISFNAMDEELLNKAKKIVTKNIDNIEFSADDFAQEMGMSRSNLHLKLKAITGESTIEFIRKIRFKRACELLEDGRYSVAEVSTMVGFNTPSYFATSFKKYFGYLPTEYIKNRRG